jgi:hypothetical protein
MSAFMLRFLRELVNQSNKKSNYLKFHFIIRSFSQFLPVCKSTMCILYITPNLYRIFQNTTFPPISNFIALLCNNIILSHKLTYDKQCIEIYKYP